MLGMGSKVGKTRFRLHGRDSESNIAHLCEKAGVSCESTILSLE